MLRADSQSIRGRARGRCLAAALLAGTACGGSPSGPETPDALLGRYRLESYRGERPPLAWNPQVPANQTASGWFEFAAGARCEYGFAVTNTDTGARGEVRVPCRYRITGSALAVQVEGETDYDLNGSWTAERVALRDPVGDELVYRRP